MPSPSKCEAPTACESHSGAFLIGADGGRSIVRKQMGIAFDGFTWPERFLRVDHTVRFRSSFRCLRAQLFR